MTFAYAAGSGFLIWDHEATERERSEHGLYLMAAWPGELKDCPPRIAKMLLKVYEG
jgi:hypothetical protein